MFFKTVPVKKSLYIVVVRVPCVFCLFLLFIVALYCISKLWALVAYLVFVGLWVIIYGLEELLAH
jgi:hypothetical protein